MQLKSNIDYTKDIENAFNLLNISQIQKIFLLYDENINDFYHTLLDKFLPNNITKILIKSGENYKTIETISFIWKKLTENKADRKSVLINLGGGVVCDMGGFAASTYKRGIEFINIPTTLLAQVDASVGGKTGFDFSGFKNQIGCFNNPSSVIICSEFLKTLDNKNFKSGFAEMIKHALVYDREHYTNILGCNIEKIDYKKLLNLTQKSISIKEYFVSNDPFEKNIRKTLNFGHTIGHAFESYFLDTDKEILHGYAVAYGIIIELILSYKILNFPLQEIEKINKFITETYGKISFTIDDYEALFGLMQQDKKNENNLINFTLLEKIGKAKINQTATEKEIFEAFDYYLNIDITKKE